MSSKKINVHVSAAMDDDCVILTVEGQQVRVPCEIKRLDTMEFDIDVGMHDFINAVTEVTRGKLFE